MIGAVPMAEEPLREVRSREVIPHPSGKFIVMDTFTCGHSVWRWRRTEPRKPPRPGRCTGCWLDVVLRARRT